MNFNQSTTVNGRISVNGLRALLNDLFKRRESLTPGGATNEATLAAAVFGLSILPSSKFPFLNALISDSKPKIRYQSASNSDASFDISADNFISSSCSSSSSGCGGGCSGCGGCGD
ncbi:MAG: hypothetical protein NT027_18955 [Proteobacteria bacterium]|nr:hypothetical protein [Pseudomonadota bacterium]